MRAFAQSHGTPKPFVGGKNRTENACSSRGTAGKVHPRTAPSPRIPIERGRGSAQLKSILRGPPRSRCARGEVSARGPRRIDFLTFGPWSLRLLHCPANRSSIHAHSCYLRLRPITPRQRYRAGHSDLALLGGSKRR
jgi:hypothetical protein